MVEPVTCFGALDLKVTYGYARKPAGSALESTAKDKFKTVLTNISLYVSARIASCCFHGGNQ